ncbi:hypothetical protein VOLCADRAFT_88724 [Volvox carteri f. nagariensis]|uniref:O-fucosyltransferase family protein n=1 Tax=Volvox carteri f. nagariensis TaxID=3068 RepID=D8TPS7_VOLCA|nr:uncharacterized protein VOLCADRAFT_88724 [Volvox carteri f. nagariensis]EFJ50284.1 hypothetical protein VOLCADRAFT_88724 [Volvox carteri f. nagariensis]|eukprot:XP_002948409.1 hypothetical protein VOLCADRAFT_88724 [Volvox carteri f. nagariensis]
MSLIRFLSPRHRRLLPNGPLVLACIALIGTSIWIYPSTGPISGGVLGVDGGESPKFLLVQCHRGQFSNRLKCLKLGILLARTLQRVLVMPMFTDVVPMVDVSKYVSLECLRRNSQAVTFDEFREHICHAVGLETPQPASAGTARPVGNTTPADLRRGAFCEDDSVLQLETGFSLEDYRGYNCWNRREDLTNARDLGIQVSGCTHVPPAPEAHSYSLAEIRRNFAGRTEKVMLFLDLFGVNLLPNLADLADTIAEPRQVCSWMPTEAAAAAADSVMQILIPPQQLPLGIATAAAAAAITAAGGSAAAAAAGGIGSLSLPALLDPTSHRTLSMGASDSALEPPPVRLRGARRYAAVHLRRADWFYYCGGSGHCFYSIAEAAAWLNETLAARGLDTLYVATNADSREKMMLRRAVAARVLFWEDALAQLLSWQAGRAESAAMKAAAEVVGPEEQDGSGAGPGAGGEEGAHRPQRSVEEAAAPLPRWLQSLPLDDELMVQMVEKAICMQSAFFVSSIGSTFSSQIQHFRNGGLEDVEWGVIESKFPALVTPWTAETATAMANANALPDGSGGDGAIATEGKFVSLREGATFLCDMQPPKYPDQRRLPDYHNPRVFVEQMTNLLSPLRSAVLGLWHRVVKGESASDAPMAAASPPPPAHGRHWPTLSQALLRAPVRVLEWLSLVVADGHAMAAANRFVDMYTGGAMVALLVEGRVQVPAAALADCVVAAAAEAGAVSLHVTLVEVPADQQVLLMQELEGRTELGQVTRMGGPGQERENTFTLLWRGEGLSRHAEPALLEELPTFLERVDAYVLAKARVLLGDSRGLLFRQSGKLHYCRTGIGSCEKTECFGGFLPTGGPGGVPRL